MAGVLKLHATIHHYINQWYLFAKDTKEKERLMLLCQLTALGADQSTAKGGVFERDSFRVVFFGEPVRRLGFEGDFMEALSSPRNRDTMDRRRE